MDLRITKNQQRYGNDSNDELNIPSICLFLELPFFFISFESIFANTKRHLGTECCVHTCYNRFSLSLLSFVKLKVLA